MCIWLIYVLSMVYKCVNTKWNPGTVQAIAIIAVFLREQYNGDATTNSQAFNLSIEQMKMWLSDD